MKDYSDTSNAVTDHESDDASKEQAAESVSTVVTTRQESSSDSKAAFNQPRYWLMWVLATAAGWLIGSLINFAIIRILNVNQINLNVEQIPQSQLLTLAIVSVATLLSIGFAIGALQWLVLRQQLPDLRGWMLFTALGFALGAWISIYFMGLGVGVLQWLILRRTLSKAGWWPVISVVTWPLGYLVGGSLGALIGNALNSIILATLIGFGVVGAVIGGITGAVLLWLLRENRAALVPAPEKGAGR